MQTRAAASSFPLEASSQEKLPFSLTYPDGRREEGWRGGGAGRALPGPGASAEEPLDGAAGGNIKWPLGGRRGCMNHL